ncbi:diguanylate cyclase/phosphodiesterase (GGDEF & EAL domains) with PAS/PAC sensor(s) [Alloactinosynnema sp. L-07]|uniref:putative bifunctional diguanylate cyclase/phosphodiesterase n=1 Tax=Alloactinosynnema sp. L-07 TaxID=1653480 RepID=UPI00065F079E|nr:EAL domain-containing protein [Alloactinosynnema sp. L-07]CRK57156.1 diguanylate cyclase/phosphodiesterase (GGDEF & EAL domains) with PAS/PAC sensor(s) [Alloactinosynnema sp. L-07]
MTDHETAPAEILSATDTAFALTDRAGTVRWVNPAMAMLLGLTEAQSVGRSLCALLSGAPDAPSDNDVMMPLPGVSGGYRWLEVRCTATDDGLLYRAVDVTRWRTRELDSAAVHQEELLRLVDEDPLTGLPNRRALTRELERQLALGVRGAFLLLDLDHFKDVNDLHGHPTGDKVMCTLASLLRDRIGGGQVLGRLSGDEFAAVLADTDEREAVAVADRLRNAIAAIPMNGVAGASRITVSIGVATFDSGVSWQEVLANADMALYASKAAGRNRATVYEPGHYQDTQMRVTVIERVRAALKHGGFVLHAMPMVKLGSGRVIGHELLLRLEDGKEPRLGPGEFLLAAERSDLVFEIDRWVADKAIQTLVEHPYPGLRFNVNVSGRTLEDEDFGDFVLDRLTAAGVAPGRLGFEITETAAVTNLDAARSLAQQLRASGCRITLDDFGSGFGSFVHLKELPITGLKIDGEFIHGIDYGSRDTVLVQGIVDIARGLGLSVVAEWVERSTQVEALSRLGVRVAQGFHLGKPEPLESLLARPHGVWMRRPTLMHELQPLETHP